MSVPHPSTTQASSVFRPSSKQSRDSETRHDRHRHHSDLRSDTKEYPPSPRRPADPTERPRRASSTQRQSPPRARDARDKPLDEMPLESTSVASITALAATARNLFRRAKISGADFADVAAAVRSLHSVIKHLRAEAEDPDSLLNGTQQESSVYARQLTPIVEDTDFSLKQLNTILEKYGSHPSDYNNDDGEASRRAPGRQIEDRERAMLQLIRTKLANQRTHIDIFLDTVQLHNPSKQHRPVDLQHADDKQQNSIKDKVDIIAKRLFERRAKNRVSGDATDESEEEMWQQFWTELVKEGFSSDVLRKNKEVLRAYIRELDENGSVDDNPPSVRGLLDHESGATYAPPQYLPYPDTPPPADGSRQQYGSSPLPPPLANPVLYQSRGDNTSHKELLSHNLDNEKFAPQVKNLRRRPDQSPNDAANGGAHPRDQPQYYNPSEMPAQLSYERHSSDSASETEISEQLALISTRDLMDSDSRDGNMLAVHVGEVGLSPSLLPVPYNAVSPGTSPNGRTAPRSTDRGHTRQPSDLKLSPSLTHASGTSPRYVPSQPEYATPPPAYSSATGTSPIAIPSSASPSVSGFPPQPMASPRRSRLAPDTKGAEIPIEAKWTRIKRSLVSPEVLDKAGMRYEARPDFVAVLGVLSRDQIAGLARKTAEVRSGRARGYSIDAGSRAPYHHNHQEERRREKPTRQPDTSDDEDTLSSSEPIWDSSDSSDSESDAPPLRTRERSGSATDKYIPRNAAPPPTRRHRPRQRRDSATVIQEEEHEDADEEKRLRSGGKSASSGRTHPVIVEPAMNEKGSPAATSAPKPILKNRNENHVRFDSDGPREMSAADLDRERERRERHERRRRDREAGGDDRSRRRGERSERGDRDRGERERERDRGDRGERGERGDRGDRERERERSERHRDREQHSSSHRHRDRDESTRERRRPRKRAWTDTIGAVGIGGAAASLLSVLTEAAAGF